MYVFGAIGKMFKSLTVEGFLSTVFSIPSVQNALIDAITMRLDVGKTASGKTLETDQSIRQAVGKVYSVWNYGKSAQPFVDLKDTGDFYDSFAITPQKKGFDVSAEFKKEDGEIFDNFGLSFSDKDKFAEEILSPIYDEHFKDFAEEDVKVAFFEVLEKALKEGLKKI